MRTPFGLNMFMKLKFQYSFIIVLLSVGPEQEYSRKEELEEGKSRPILSDEREQEERRGP